MLRQLFLIPGRDRRCFISGCIAMRDTGTGTNKHQIRNESTTQDRGIITLAVIVLCALVLICLGMLLPPLWTVTVEAWQDRPGDQECSRLSIKAARQACEEELRVPTSRHPAEGANAPPILGPSEQRSE